MRKPFYRVAADIEGLTGYNPGCHDFGMPIAFDHAATTPAEPADLENAGWQPIRIAGIDARGRSRGFPERPVDHEKIERWCRGHCAAGWRVEHGTEQSRTYWFETADDAMAFAMAWFPFKCT